VVAGSIPARPTNKIKHLLLYLSNCLTPELDTPVTRFGLRLR